MGLIAIQICRLNLAHATDKVIGEVQLSGRNKVRGTRVSPIKIRAGRLEVEVAAECDACVRIALQNPLALPLLSTPTDEPISTKPGEADGDDGFNNYKDEYVEEIG